MAAAVWIIKNIFDVLVGENAFIIFLIIFILIEVKKTNENKFLTGVFCQGNDMYHGSTHWRRVIDVRDADCDATSTLRKETKKIRIRRTEND